MKLIFATKNQNKLLEAQSVLEQLKKKYSTKFEAIPFIEIASLNEFNVKTQIRETGKTFMENATLKSTFAHQLTHSDCFSEDSGLEVQTLGGAPGVHSARYASEKARDEENIQKLLNELKGRQNKTAAFTTVISLILGNKEYLFEGVCKGKIAEKKSGNKGFGYDPVFIPDGSNLSFASMSLEEKNRYSHRKKAFKKMILFLINYLSKKH